MKTACLSGAPFFFWNLVGMNRRLAWLWIVAMGVCGGCSFGRGNATLRDYTGLDGCGWVLESGGEVLEPINLESFLDDPGRRDEVGGGIRLRGEHVQHLHGGADGRAHLLRACALTA